MNLAQRLLSRSNGHVDVEDRAGLVALFDTQRTNRSGSDDFASHTYLNYVQHALSIPPIRALMTARARVFTEVRFKWRNMSDTPTMIQGKPVEPGELYRTDALRLLEEPWPGATTGDLLARMIQDVDLSGNSFIYRASPTRLQWLRPDWVSVAVVDTGIFGYFYHPGGSTGNVDDAKFIGVEDMAHWMPDPDPTHPFKGTTWLSALARDVNNDVDMQRHKSTFFKNSATPNLIIKVQGKLNSELREVLRDEVQRRYAGVDNAYKTMLLEGGADIVSVGHSFKEIDFARIQDAGETRMASAAGVPPVLVGFNSGLQAATYSNYLHAMRRFADATLRPLWRSAADALGNIVKTRTGDPLAFDDREVAALQQDAKDDAEILQLKAATMSSLITAGYEPDAVARAVQTGRLETLTHTGNIPTSLYNTDGVADEGDTGNNEASNDGDNDGNAES